jgi:hypothetical protein
MCLWRGHWSMIQDKSAIFLSSRGTLLGPNIPKWVNIFSWIKGIKLNIFIQSISNTEITWNLTNLQGLLPRKKLYTLKSVSKSSTSNTMRDVTYSNPGSHTCKCMWLAINKNQRVLKEYQRQPDFYWSGLNYCIIIHSTVLH